MSEEEYMTEESNEATLKKFMKMGEENSEILLRNDEDIYPNRLGEIKRISS